MNPRAIPAGRYRIVGRPVYRTSSGSNSSPYVKDGSVVVAAKEVRADPDGDVYVQVEGRDEETCVQARQLVLIPETPAPTSVGTAYVRVDVRFFIGETDITSSISAALVADLLQKGTS